MPALFEVDLLGRQCIGSSRQQLYRGYETANLALSDLGRGVRTPRRSSARLGGSKPTSALPDLPSKPSRRADSWVGADKPGRAGQERSAQLFATCGQGSPRQSRRDNQSGSAGNLRLALFDLLSGARQLPANLSDSQSPTHLTFVRSAPAEDSPTPLTAAPATPLNPPADTSSLGIAEDIRRLESSELALAAGDELETTRPLGSREQTNARGDQGAVWPVRLPYAVQLTDPIIVVPGAERTANVVVIQWFH